MPSHRVVGRLLLVFTALATAGAGRAAHAQNGDEVIDDDHARPVNVAEVRMVRLQQTLNPDQMDQWLFAQWGGVGVARNKLESALLLRIEDLGRSCGVTEPQRKKLRVAGKGDIKRFFDKVEELKRRFQQVQNAQNVNLLWQAIQPLQTELNNGLFGDDSLYAKTIRKTLNPDQLARFDTVVRERKAYRFRVTADWFVVHLDKGLGLTEDQRRRFVDVLVNETRPPKIFGHGDYWYLMLQTANVPESKLKPIFDAPQWRLLTAQFAQARGMQPWLKANGAIADDDKDGANAVIELRPARIGN